jgi:hypothetical protein
MTRVQTGAPQAEPTGRPPAAGDYWRRAGDGALVVIVSMEEAQVHFHDTARELADTEERSYTQTWQLALSSFLAQYAFEPDGPALREQEIAAISASLRDAGQRATDLGAALKAIGGGAPSGPTDAPGTGSSDESRALVLTTEGGVAHAEAQKRQVATLRNEVGKFALQMTQEQRTLDALIKEQQLALQARMKSLTGDLAAQMAGLRTMLKVAEETIWTINVYLGKDETIRLLRDGEPAPAGTKIALRQLVLFMDEESALHSDTGGIDFETIDEFDAWVLADPAHLDQLLPNVRGVVAIKPRRSVRNYADSAMVNATMDALNKHTYFLIRNGEKVYRIDSDLEVGETLFPRATEFAQLFEKTEYSYASGRRQAERTMLQPGTQAYMEALEKAKGQERHYLRVFLFLQGLLDRTTVFQPLGVPRLNVFDMLRQDDHLEFILDAEHGRQLGDGRPPFAEWLEGINDRIDVGVRVIGRFKAGEYHGRDYESRVSPRNAPAPASDALHTVDRAEEGERRRGRPAFIFLYERTDEVAKRNRYGAFQGYDAPVRRANYRLFVDDDDLINFDAATVDDMRYYLTSRRNRHEYQRMFPVLTRAIAYKEHEAEAEQPFRSALAGALMREHGIADTDANAAVAELVAWWKFKNRTHRALLSDDEKASRMILAEYALRQRLAAERHVADATFDAVAAHIAQASPALLALYHKSGAEFVAYEAMNAASVFVRESRWRANARGITCTATTEWRVTDAKKMARWHLIRSDARWATWTHDAKADEHLTDPERAMLFEQAWAEAASESTRDDAWLGRSRRARGTPTFVRLAAFAPDAARLSIYYLTHAAVMPREAVLTSDWAAPRLMRGTVGWSKKAGVVTLAFARSESSFARTPFAAEGDRDRFMTDPEVGRAPAWVDVDAVARYRDAVSAYAAARTVVVGLEALVSGYLEHATKAVADGLVAAERAKFDADYGAPELWEGHCKALKFPHVRLDGLRDALPYLVEQGIEVVGLSAAEVLAQATTLGWDGGGAQSRRHRDDHTITEAPAAYRFAVLPVAPNDEEDGDDESDDGDDGDDGAHDDDACA